MLPVLMSPDVRYLKSNDQGWNSIENNRRIVSLSMLVEMASGPNDMGSPLGGGGGDKCINSEGKNYSDLSMTQWASRGLVEVRAAHIGSSLTN